MIQIWKSGNALETVKQQYYLKIAGLIELFHER
jgi:hypothetical protein